MALDETIYVNHNDVLRNYQQLAVPTKQDVYRCSTAQETLCGNTQSLYIWLKLSDTAIIT